MATPKKTATSKAAAGAKKSKVPKHIGLVKNDAYLEPFEDAIRGRIGRAHV